MAYLQTINNEIHHVKETAEEIRDIMNSQESLATELVPLTMAVKISNYDSKLKMEVTNTNFEKTYFLKRNIVFFS